MENKAFYVGHADGDKTIYNGRVDTETSTYNATSDNVRIAVDNKMDQYGLKKTVI